jgi:hypothetical protein
MLGLDSHRRQLDSFMRGRRYRKTRVAYASIQRLSMLFMLNDFLLAGNSRNAAANRDIAGVLFVLCPKRSAF